MQWRSCWFCSFVKRLEKGLISSPSLFHHPFPPSHLFSLSICLLLHFYGLKMKPKHQIWSVTFAFPLQAFDEISVPEQNSAKLHRPPDEKHPCASASGLLLVTTASDRFGSSKTLHKFMEMWRQYSAILSLSEEHQEFLTLSSKWFIQALIIHQYNKILQNTDFSNPFQKLSNTLIRIKRKINRMMTTSWL